MRLDGLGLRCLTGMLCSSCGRGEPWLARLAAACATVLEHEWSAVHDMELGGLSSGLSATRWKCMELLSDACRYAMHLAAMSTSNTGCAATCSASCEARPRATAVVMAVASTLLAAEVLPSRHASPTRLPHACQMTLHQRPRSGQTAGQCMQVCGMGMHARSAWLIACCH